MRRTTHWMTRMALLTAVALVLGYIENLFPPLVPSVPGIKLGLSNTVLLYALYLLDFQSAAVLMLLKVGLSGLLYAGFGASLFSLGGGLLSLGAMWLLRRVGGGGFSVLGVSVAGAVFHNLGQLLVSIFLVNTMAMLAFLPFLLVAAVVTGILTGVAANYVIHTLEKIT